MRLATFTTPDSDQPLAGEIRGDTAVPYTDGRTVIEMLASGDRTPADGAPIPLAGVTLLAPVPKPTVIYAIGLNYSAHIKETGNTPPEQPIVFTKMPHASIGPAGPVVRPAATKKLDYESELVIVIGKDGEIAGYAVADDVSARDLQRREPQWTRAKGADTFCPWGPWITTADDAGDAGNLRLTAHVNGELRQDSNTNDLLFGIEKIVDFISETNTLDPGDIILTGTPSGVGAAMDPPQFLVPGDVVRCEVEGLGVVEHTIVDP